MNRLKKRHLLLTLLLVMISLYGLSHIFFSRMEKNWHESHEFRFSLPLPQDIVDRYSLTNDIEIDKVIIAGYFSSWNPMDDDYIMDKIGTNTWSIKLDLLPGRNKYKFVIHTKRPVYDKIDGESRKQIWVHDVNAMRLKPDSFGGKNSLHIIPNFREIKRVSNTVFLGFIILVLLYIILKPIIQKFIILQLSYRLKLVLVTGVILMTSNVLYVIYNMIELRALSKETYIDETHFILKPLTEKFEKVKDVKTIDLQEVEVEISNVLYNTTDRDEKNKFQHNQFKISSVMVLNSEYDEVLFSIRPQSDKLEKLLMPASEYTNLNDFFYRNYYGDIIEKIKQKKYSPFIPEFDLKNYKPNPDRPRTTDFSRLATGYDVMIVPLRTKKSLYGYAILALHTNLLGREILRIFAFNGLMMVFILGLMYFLLYDLGGILSMEEEARKDGLTGIYNRRTIDIVLQQEIRRSCREKTSLGVMILDLDHFKKVNDTYGHLAGDAVLKQASAIIESCIRRPADEIGRYGGEEFVIILPNTDAKGVKIIAETVRKKLETLVCKWEELELSITTSIGYFACTPLTSTEVKDFYAKADQALYMAKEQGRNRSVQWKASNNKK